MAKDFSFPFYINNWIGGVMYFTFEQKGAYLELLLLQFNHGRFTESQVKQVLNTSYSNVWDAIKSKFEFDGNFYWNEKMEQVKIERKNFVESRRNNRLGKIKEPKKDEIKNNTSKTLVKLVEGKDESNSKDKNKTKGVQGEIILPYDSEEFKKVWYVLIATKKWRKKEKTALQASLVKLSKYPEAEAIEMMQNAIAGEWQGLFETETRKKTGHATTKTNHLEPISRGSKAINDLADAIENNGGAKRGQSAS